MGKVIPFPVQPKQYIVIECRSSTGESLHPHIALWKKGDGDNFAQEMTHTGWLSDWGYGNYEADIQDSVKMTEFHSLKDALDFCPEVIQEAALNNLLFKKEPARLSSMTEKAFLSLKEGD